MADPATVLTLGIPQSLIAGILVMFLGSWLNRRIRVLEDLNLPEPVTGGLLAAVALALAQIGGISVVLDTGLRDTLLLVFFTTVGLSARISLLLSGGKALLLLGLAAAAVVVSQSLIGVALAKAIGLDPRLGLVAGSISFCGGHGTAIAWSGPLAAVGVKDALEAGIAVATVGLVAGGLVGSPAARRLINRNHLTAASDPEGAKDSLGQDVSTADVAITYPRALRAALLLAVTISIGLVVGGLVARTGFTLPAFVSCMFTGIVLTNALPPLMPRIQPWPGSGPTLALVAQLALGLFLALSMMGIQVSALLNLALPLLAICLVQVAFVVFVALPLVFRLLGRTYDAAVMGAGFTGLTLGATPTAIANMTALTTHLGPSPRSFIVVPLVGAFLVDLVNAAVINLGLSLLSRY